MKTETETMKRVIKIAEQGDFFCQMQLAETYRLGAVVKRDFNKAAYWAQQATMQAFRNSDLPATKKQGILAAIEQVKI